MKLDRLILTILDETLCLNGRARFFDMDTPLLGHLPELDSMAVVALISALEEKLNITIEYGDINAANFATVRALIDFAHGKVGETS